MTVRCPICNEIIGSPYVSGHHKKHDLDRDDFIRKCGLKSISLIALKQEPPRQQKIWVDEYKGMKGVRE